MLRTFRNGLDILWCLALCTTASAQATPKKSFADQFAEDAGLTSEYSGQATQQVYERIRVLEGLIFHEALIASQGNALRPADPDAASAERIRNWEVERQMLVLALEERGTGRQRDRYSEFALGQANKPTPAAVDALAAFYAAQLSQESAKKLGASDERSRLYEKAVAFWRLAGDAGDPAAYWNLATMYESGKGVIRSRLAAMEWYYRAGLGFLKIGQREKALAALEQIERIDPKSPLGRKLDAQLLQGAPK